MKLDKSSSKSTVNLPCFGVFASRSTSRPLFVSAGLNGKECFQNAAAYLKFHNQIHRTGKAIVRRALAVAEFGREEVTVIT